MDKLKLLLIIVLIWLQYDLWLGKNGVYDYFKVKNDIINQKNINFCLKMRNERLFAEINDLYDGQDALEERARNDLLMIKPEESYYYIMKKQ
ncbi:Cell division protein FtsB [Candidatus Providencia siddallii]|uniref:Cell division protein FtsB n=1 Tax=Candidatus Providencia siddallii TaxID=1715285 RepID=A0A0M6W841_9GAMM|nr:Cell division protein FtsB [Candidatus Providencia siddallii]